MSRKGRRFEIEVCSQLSRWWTGGADDDAFYHTHVSGARATVRGRKGKRTAGAYGDIMATDHRGAPLLDLMAWEVKRGYARATVHDLLDKPPTAAVQEWEGWFAQAEQSAGDAGSYGWAVVAKRDKRAAVIFMPSELYDGLVWDGFWGGSGSFPGGPFVSLEAAGVSAVGMPWWSFLEGAPAVVKKLSKRL